MDQYERLTRQELIALMHEHKAECERLSTGAPDHASNFLVFGEWERREFEASAWPIRIFDRESLKYVAANAAALKLYGYTLQEFLDLTPLDTLHPEERDRIIGSLAEASGYLVSSQIAHAQRAAQQCCRAFTSKRCGKACLAIQPLR